MDNKNGFTNRTVEAARKQIVKAERVLGVMLTRGQCRDLLLDHYSRVRDSDEAEMLLTDIDNFGFSNWVPRVNKVRKDVHRLTEALWNARKTQHAHWEAIRALERELESLPETPTSIDGLDDLDLSEETSETLIVWANRQNRGRTL